ncbi:hypothetical protein [Nocardioides caricicola]|uniref:Uncharacterized protein n=1 Tax=Nocardioides caricicola TaxID=634770 RepID=A0ABW0N801_9ACTN
MRDLRKLVSALVIVSFSFAALLGIGAIVSGGVFGETEVNVLITTVIVGCESVAALCYLGLAGHRLAVLGAVGGLTSVVATATALMMTWSETLGGAHTWQVFGVSATLAWSFAQACLLLALVGRHRVEPALALTLLAIAVVATMISVPIVTESVMTGNYWRAFGVIAILDVLGTIVLTAVGVFRRRPGPMPSGPLLDPSVEARLVAAAGARHTSPSQLVDDALDALLAGHGGGGRGRGPA